MWLVCLARTTQPPANRIGAPVILVRSKSLFAISTNTTIVKGPSQAGWPSSCSSCLPSSLSWPCALMPPQSPPSTSHLPVRTAPSIPSLLSTPRHPIPQPLLARRQRLVDRWFAYQGLGGGERNRGGAAPHTGRRGAGGPLALWCRRDQDGERGCRHLHPLEHARPHRRRQQYPLHRRGTATPLRLWWITILRFSITIACRRLAA